MTTDAHTGSPIRNLRKKLRLTQSALAELLGVHRLEVTYWENGRRKPSRMAQNFMRHLEEIHDKRGHAENPSVGTEAKNDE